MVGVPYTELIRGGRDRLFWIYRNRFRYGFSMLRFKTGREVELSDAPAILPDAVAIVPGLYRRVSEVKRLTAECVDEALRIFQIEALRFPPCEGLYIFRSPRDRLRGWEFRCFGRWCS